MNKSEQQIDYKTHILIGVHASDVMTVIADWPYVPPQADVQKEIDCTREPYVTFGALRHQSCPLNAMLPKR